jgi:sporadic carbohydrate cluster 2OG-Fe(II) oxygenase
MYDEFEQQGYVIVFTKNMQVLNKVRSHVRDKAYSILGKGTSDLNDDINQLHKHFDNTQQIINFKETLYQELIKGLDVSAEIYNAFDEYIKALVGADILYQQHPFIVFQPPNYEYPTNFHRDAPADSFYQLNVWVPLTDCYSTKTIYLLNVKDSKFLLNTYRNPSLEDANVFDFVLENAQKLIVPYGYGLLFWSGLLHGSFINKENESRLSINVRFKNRFTPPGALPDHRCFKVLKQSALTILAQSTDKD